MIQDRDQAERRAISFVSQAIDCDPDELTPQSRLRSHPHWDSLGQVSVLAMLEASHGIVIREDTLDHYSSIAHIADLFMGGDK
jgi:acyl carrier protein